MIINIQDKETVSTTTGITTAVVVIKIFNQNQFDIT